MDEHIAYYQRLIAQDPKHADAHLHLAALLCRQGKHQEAISTYQAAATLLSDAGQLQEAISASKCILDIDPQHTDTHLTLARLYARLPQARARIAQVIVPAPVLAPVGEPVEEAELIVLSPAAAVKEPLPSAPPSSAPPPAPPAVDVGAPEPQAPGDDTIVLDDASLADALEQGLDVASIDIAVDDEGPLSLEELLEGSDDIFSSDGFEALLRDSIHHSLKEDTALGAVQDAAAEARASKPEVSPLAEHNLSARASQAIGRLSRRAPPVSDSLGLPGVALPPPGFDDGLSSQTSALPVTAHAESAPPGPAHSAELRVEDVALPPSPILMHLSAEDRSVILKQAKLRRVRRGELFNGEEASHRALSLLIEGRVRVECDTPSRVLCLARVERGDFVGEFELLTGRRSKVRLLAETPLVVMELSHAVLNAIIGKDPTIWQVLWTRYHERLLNNLLALSPLFGGLSADARSALAAEFTRIEAHAEQVVVRQGQQDHGLYLVARGDLVVKTTQQNTSQVIAELGEGDFFGTLAGVARQPSKTSVYAVHETTLFVLRHSRLKSFIRQHPDAALALRRLGAPRRLVVGKSNHMIG